MHLISLTLLSTWLTSVVVGFTMGGFVHLLAIAAVVIVFTSGNRVPRRA